MAAPVMTFGSPGNLRPSANIAGAANATHDIDLSTKVEGILTVKSTPTGTPSATKGLQVDIYARYGSTPDVGTIPLQTVVLPSAASGVAEIRTLYLGTGRYRVRFLNLDATVACTVEATLDTIDGIA